MELISRFVYFFGMLYSIFSHEGVESFGFNTEVPIKVSWYGEYFHGRRTANGETYDITKFTCASPRLPFNSLVTLNYGNEYLIVRVNDRGPYAVDSLGKVIHPLQPHPVRRLDLSMAAFKHLTGNLSMGVANVYVVSIIER